MKLTFLGTGTSQGIPVISCKCATCTSSDPRDKRLRCSIYIELDNQHFIIDIGPDFRYQMLTNKLSKLNFALLTHEHNDHTAGIDDVRPINFATRKDLEIYCKKSVAEDLEKRFRYIFNQNPYPGAPRINLNHLTPNKSINIEGIDILPLLLDHGNLPILGYRIGNVAYLTDVSDIPEESVKQLEDIDVLIISALRNKKHQSHLTLSQSLKWIEKINPKTAYLTHMSHLLGPTKLWEKELPFNVYPAYDGLSVEIKSN